MSPQSERRPVASNHLTFGPFHQVYNCLTDAAADSFEERFLTRLAELDMSLAEKVHACAMAEDDPAVVAEIARAYQRIARSLRQTLALRSKLAREADVDARQAAERARSREIRARHDAREAIEKPYDQHKADIGARLLSVIWDEAEGEEAEFERLEHLVSRRLEIEQYCPGFLDMPVEQLAAKVAAKLGFRFIPPPPKPPPPPGPPLSTPALETSG